MAGEGSRPGRARRCAGGREQARCVAGNPARVDRVPPGMKRSEHDVESVLAWLKRRGSKRNRDGMARYAIVSDKAFGVSVTEIRRLSKEIGRDHGLALRLWRTGHLEARMLTAFVDDPALVTPVQMDRWCKDFDNWAVCDALCFHLF